MYDINLLDLILGITEVMGPVNKLYGASLEKCTVWLNSSAIFFFFFPPVVLLLPQGGIECTFIKYPTTHSGLSVYAHKCTAKTVSGC